MYYIIPKTISDAHTLNQCLYQVKGFCFLEELLHQEHIKESVES